MKQKVVIKISLNDSKSRTKAMQIAVSVPGVISAEIQGAEMDQIVVTGEDIDSPELTRKIRKKVGYAELLTVTPIPEKKEEKKEEEKDVKKDNKKDDTKEPVVHPIVWTPYQYGAPHFSEPQFGAPQFYGYDVQKTNQDSCAIM